MSKILWGFTLGLVTGLLLAPEKGSQTRERIRRKANDLKDKFDDFIDTVTDKFDSFKDDVEGVSSQETRSFAGEARFNM
jgi:gas vesicle protein